MATIMQTENPASFTWTITADPWLPAGTIIPLDREGKPILKPQPSPRESTEQSK